MGDVAVDRPRKEIDRDKVCMWEKNGLMKEYLDEGRGMEMESARTQQTAEM